MGDPTKTGDLGDLERGIGPKLPTENPRNFPKCRSETSRNGPIVRNSSRSSGARLAYRHRQKGNPSKVGDLGDLGPGQPNAKTIASPRMESDGMSSPISAAQITWHEGSVTPEER